MGPIVLITYCWWRWGLYKTVWRPGWPEDLVLRARRKCSWAGRRCEGRRTSHIPKRWINVKVPARREAFDYNYYQNEMAQRIWTVFKVALLLFFHFFYTSQSLYSYESCLRAWKILNMAIRENRVSTVTRIARESSKIRKENKLNHYKVLHAKLKHCLEPKRLSN